MAKFRSAKYPALTLQDDKGIWARFEGGQLETTDAAVVKRLRGLPESEGISEVKAPAKTEGDAKKE
ncbi:hypothetical protein LRD69_14040 [Streptomyces sp. JH14]|uniref:hypothetical protein n=1 Tax=Streptomyces sp. JH14 TaxID=2793630 RepID=UPI0023F6A2F4|nr:hypothetical protein [Streptomyces sp. JH14]MDF6043249.1 hypothetical protein [Streptomyces sp. JH14]